MTASDVQTTPRYGQPGTGEPYDGAASAASLNRPLYGASFGQAVSRFFKNYATFSGRASRSEYWWVYLFMTLVTAVFSVLLGITIASTGVAEDGTAQLTGGAIAVIVVFSLFGLATIIPSLALLWRRLHDANLAGPFAFLSLIPSVGSIIVLVMTLLPPKPEGRRFDRS